LTPIWPIYRKPNWLLDLNRSRFSPTKLKDIVMLKTMIAAGVAAATLSLAACNVPSTGNPQLDTLLNQAAAIAQQACGIEVVGVEIASMIPGVNVAGLTAVQIANQLCASALSRGKFGGPVGATKTVRIAARGVVAYVMVRRLR
jgi:hypothetical protein